MIRIALLGPALICLLSLSGTASAQTRTLAPSYDLAATNFAEQGTDRWNIAGSEENSHFGKIIRSGDINGDGIDDAIVASDTAVKVWLGSTTAPRLLMTAAADLTFTCAPADSIQEIQTGDLNGDGRADLVVTAAYQDPGENIRTYVAVFFGAAGIYPQTRMLAYDAHQQGMTFIQRGGSEATVFLKDGEIEIGDINGDGKADLLLGSPLGQSSPMPYHSVIHVVYGRQDFPSGVNLEVQSDIQFVAPNEDRIGTLGTLRIADVTGDGRNDILVGAPGFDPHGDPVYGRCYIIAGRSTPFPPVLNLYYGGYSPENLITEIRGRRSGDALTGGIVKRGGKTVAAADVNGDGIQDVILSAHQAGSPSKQNSGEVDVIYGRPAFHQQASQPRVLDMAHPQYGEVLPNMIIYGDKAGDRLTEGGSLRTGDVNGDGIDDLVLGAPRTTVSGAGTPQEANAYIVLGKEHFLNAPQRVANLSQLPTDGTQVRIHASSSDDSMLDGGAALLLADITGDGVQDIILGAPAKTVPAGLKQKAGYAFVIAGRTAFPNKLFMDRQDSLGATSYIMGAMANDSLTSGGAMAIGDVTGDGTPDLILGAPNAERHTNPAVGAAYVIGGGSPRPRIAAKFGSRKVVHEENLRLGALGAGVSYEWQVTLSNIGRAPLQIQNVRLYNDFQKEFTLDTRLLPPALPPRSQAVCTLKVKFKSTAETSRNIKFSLVCNDPESSDFFFVLEGGVTKAEVPPLPISEVSVTGPTSAKARISISSPQEEQRVTLSYGRNKNLTGAETRSFEVYPSSNDLMVRDYTLTGLLPHTVYYYQIRIQSPMGTTVTKLASFTTANSGLSIYPETYAFTATPGAVVRIKAADHVTDADGDPLTVVSVTQPEFAGKVVKEKDGAVFLADADFLGRTESVTFTMVVRDGFGSEGTLTVQVTPVTTTLASSSVQLSAYGQSRDLPVELPSGTFWNASKKDSWITLTEFPGDSFVQIQVAPNNSIKSRTARLIIAGQPFDVIQAAAIKPVIELPEEAAFTAYVSRDYEAVIPTSDMPVKYRVTGLPPGLVFSADGHIQGKPTKAGKYPVKITASNAAGAANDDVTFEINVLPLDPALPGTFYGVTTTGSRIDFTTTSSGAISGKVTRITQATAFRSQLECTASLTSFTSLPVKGRPEWQLQATFNTETRMMEGSVEGETFVAWRSGWAYDKTQATAYSGAYSFRLRSLVFAESNPHGDGFGSFTVAVKNGGLTVSGRLPDGSAYVTKTAIGDQGQVLLYQPLYRNKGILSGMLDVTPAVPADENTVSSLESYHPRWHKPVTTDRNYPDGFLISLEAKGGRLPGIASGGVIMDGEATLETFTASQRGAAAVFAQDFTITNPSTKGVTNKATAQTPVTNAAVISTLTPATGAFGGSFSLTTDVPAEKRVVSYLGQLVSIDGQVRGYGYYLLPDLPNPKTSLLYSGQILLQPLASGEE